MKRKLDSRGRFQPEHRTTGREVARRRDIAYRFWREGYMRVDIAEALGVSPTAVSADLRAMGVKEKRYSPLLEGKPPKTPWLSDEIEIKHDSGAHYLHSLALAMIENSVDHLTRERITNMLAHDVSEALYAEDEAWISHARATLSRMNVLISRLHSVLDNPEQRTLAMANSTEVVVPVLREVK